MKTETRKVAVFRNRLANRQSSWAIDIPAKRRITLELTDQQQEILQRVTKHVIPSVTLIFYSDDMEPSGRALAYLKMGRSVKGPRRAKRASRAARS